MTWLSDRTRTHRDGGDPESGLEARSTSVAPKVSAWVRRDHGDSVLFMPEPAKFRCLSYARVSLV
jgi:hypothetical protein